MCPCVCPHVPVVCGAHSKAAAGGEDRQDAGGSWEGESFEVFWASGSLPATFQSCNEERHDTDAHSSYAAKSLLAGSGSFSSRAIFRPRP